VRIETRELTVNEARHGMRLDLFLKENYPQFSRQEWQKRIDEGAIKINGLVGKASRKLNTRDIISFSYSMRDEPEVPQEIPIVFEDDHYLVVNKPPGLPVHPSGIYKTQTLTTFLAERKILVDGYLLHRLDRETSGVLALAKHRAAAVAFQREQRAGRIEKYYLALAEGIVKEKIDAGGLIYRMAGQTLSRRRFFAATAPADAMEIQSCRTVFTPLAQHGELCLIECQLFTGRMHQIRATLQALGYPIVGDKLYGRDPELYFRFVDETLTAEDWRLLRMTRSALHAHRLRLNHPVTGAAWDIIAPLPQDIAALIEK